MKQYWSHFGSLGLLAKEISKSLFGHCTVTSLVGGEDVLLLHFLGVLCCRLKQTPFLELGISRPLSRFWARRRQGRKACAATLDSPSRLLLHCGCDGELRLRLGGDRRRNRRCRQHRLRRGSKKCGAKVVNAGSVLFGSFNCGGDDRLQFVDSVHGMTVWLWWRVKEAYSNFFSKHTQTEIGQYFFIFLEVGLWHPLFIEKHHGCASLFIEKHHRVCETGVEPPPAGCHYHQTLCPFEFGR
jgi:hypothetical protein